MITGLPSAASRPLVRHYRIEIHKQRLQRRGRGWAPRSADPEQYRQLHVQGRLQELAPAEKKRANQGELRIAFSLPRHAVSLLQVSW